MKKRKGIANAVLAACVSLFATCGFAQAVDEDQSKSNDSPDSAQELSITGGAGVATATAATAKGGASVNGIIGNLTGAAVPDVDFYSFYGKAGDVVTINIDGGMGGVRSVDTIVALFGPKPEYRMLRLNDDAPRDAGSISSLDSRIENFGLDADGFYTVGVSFFPRSFTHGGVVTNPTSPLGFRSNGDYTLHITGVTVSKVIINIEVKPGSDEFAPINPKAKGVLPVALLGSSRYDALAVKRDSLKFGATGYESSWLRCAKEGKDINNDGYLDLVCHFDNQLTRFVKGDLEGILTGETGDGYQMEGRGVLKVVPEKRD